MSEPTRSTGAPVVRLPKIDWGNGYGRYVSREARWSTQALADKDIQSLRDKNPDAPPEWLDKQEGYVLNGYRLWAIREALAAP